MVSEKEIEDFVKSLLFSFLSNKHLPYGFHDIYVREKTIDFSQFKTLDELIEHGVTLTKKRIDDIQSIIEKLDHSNVSKPQFKQWFLDHYNMENYAEQIVPNLRFIGGDCGVIIIDEIEGDVRTFFLNIFEDKFHDGESSEKYIEDVSCDGCQFNEEYGYDGIYGRYRCPTCYAQSKSGFDLCYICYKLNITDHPHPLEKVDD